MPRRTPRKKSESEELPTARCDYCGAEIPAGRGLKIVAPVRQGGKTVMRVLRFCNWREAYAFIMFLVSSEWDAAKAAQLVQNDPAEMMYG